MHNSGVLHKISPTPKASIIQHKTDWEMYITAQGRRLRNDLYCVEWDVKL